GGEVSIGGVTGELFTTKKKLFQKKHSHSDAVAIVLWDGSLTMEPISRGILKDIRDRRENVS
ncbi:MAG: hypothetical protein J6N76_10540, partial [Lachnospiraceae bacterium]|nr:hypothetical protein [Lachnospiraceae bacterium]